MPPTPPPDPKRAPTDPLERQIQRVEKLAGFGAQLAGAMRTEFIYYWDHPQRRIEVPEAGPFVTRVDALASVLADGNLDLHGPFRLHAGGYDLIVP